MPVLWLGASACAVERGQPAADPVYEGDVEALLADRCGACHLGPDATAGYRVSPYSAAIACPQGAAQQSVVLPAGPDAQLLRALRHGEQHVGLLTSAELATLTQWIEAGAPLRAGGVHGGDILHPGAAGFHGRLAATDNYLPLRSEEHAWTCGRCHAHAPTKPPNVAYPAPSATACTDCHDDPQGALSCGTCHDEGANPYPEQPRCFSSKAADDLHGLHLRPGAALPTPLACSQCHPGDGRLGGQHGDGHVDIAFAALGPEKAGSHYDSASGKCAVYCHQGLGELTEPSWFVPLESPRGCPACHDAPPRDHYGGPCSACHAQVDDSGSLLQPGALHLNGRIDLGTGGTGCGSCHGDGSDAFPDEPVHRAHHTTSVSLPVPCSACHPVPQTLASPGHLDARGAFDPADVALDPAIAGENAYYESGTCRAVACHGDGEQSIDWTPRPALGCDGCHGTPPPPPHSPSRHCADLFCHGGEIRPEGDGWAITEAGRLLHLDGVVQSGLQ